MSNEVHDRVNDAVLTNVPVMDCESRIIFKELSELKTQASEFFDLRLVVGLLKLEEARPVSLNAIVELFLRSTLMVAQVKTGHYGEHSFTAWMLR